MSLVSLRTKEEAAASAADDHSYHQNWYPLALSTEVAPGALVGKDIMGTRVLVYRDELGQPVVQSGFCPHLGADLSAGQLIDGRVRCAFHHWTFDKTGQCVHISTGGKIPPAARISNYPVNESLGVIWVFNGEKPLYEVPRMPDVDPDELVFATYAGETRYVEHWLPVSNAVDFQHLRALHGMPFEEPPDGLRFDEFQISYSFGAGPTLRTTRVIGTNTFAAHTDSVHADLFVMTSRIPVQRRASAGVFIVATRKPKEDTEAERARIRGLLDMFAASTRKLLAEDATVLDTMRFRQGLLVEADRHLARYFKYVRSFPSARPLDFY